MAKIRKSFINNENLLDDSNIDNHFVGKRFNNFKNLISQIWLILSKKRKF